MSLKQRIQEDVKTAMRAGDKPRVAAIRMITAAIKQREVDERIDDLNDEQVIATLDKMAKQRKESIEHYENAGRDDLAEKERYELQLLQQYLPEALSDAEIDALIDEAVMESGAASIKEMGKVMGALKPKLQGRADMSTVSAKVKDKLGG